MEKPPDLFNAAAAEAEAVLPAPQATPPSLLARIFVLVTHRNRKPIKKTTGPARLPLPSPKRLEASLSKTAFNPAAADPTSTVLYLAYGSNLCHETFQGRRGIRPLSAVNVVVPEIKLVFTLQGFPYNEPCFASSARRDAIDAQSPDIELSDDENTVMIEKPDATPALIGVVYEVTAKDYAHIIATEGPTYTDIIVTCNALSTPNTSSSSAIPTGPFQAHTLLAPPSAMRRSPLGKPPQPSLRYLTLCRNGAAEHGLPDEWQSYLRHLQHYQITTVSQRMGQVTFLMLWAPIILLFLGLRRISASPDGKVPPYLTKVTNFLFKGLWFSYDHFFYRVFGNGERTIERKIVGSLEA